MMDINYWGVFHWTRCVLPEMRRRGSGHIVNVSSAAGKFGTAMSNGYSASKFALTGLSESLHRELLGSKVYVSCVHPGSIKTDFANEETMPKELLSPLIRYSPKLSAAATAGQIGYCIWLRLPVRTFPLFVGLLTRVNAIWIRLGDFMLWKWFYPILALYLIYSIIF